MNPTHLDIVVEDIEAEVRRCRHAARIAPT
jgi:hypothetical protein